MMKNYRIYSDQELVQLMPTGDERILVEIYDRYWDKMLAVAFNRLGNLEEAEECVQDVLYKLWKLRANFSLTQANLATYLARAIRNHTFNVLEKRHRIRKKMATYGQEFVDSISPERKLILAELQQQLDKAIGALPAQCQLVFRLHKGDGLPVKEIASRLNLSENTIKSHLKKARKDLGNNTEFLTTFVFVYACLQQFY